MHLSMAVNSKHIYKYMCGITLCARAGAQLSALPLGDQRRSDTIHYAQANL